MDDFEKAMQELDNKGNDFDDICYFEGGIERIINKAIEYLLYAVNLTTGGEELQHPLCIRITGKLSGAECQYEKTFYSQLIMVYVQNIEAKPWSLTTSCCATDQQVPWQLRDCAAEAERQGEQFYCVAFL